MPSLSIHYRISFFPQVLHEPPQECIYVYLVSLNNPCVEPFESHLAPISWYHDTRGKHKCTQKPGRITSRKQLQHNNRVEIQTNNYAIMILPHEYIAEQAAGQDFVFKSFFLSLISSSHFASNCQFTLWWKHQLGRVLFFVFLLLVLVLQERRTYALSVWMFIQNSNLN